MKQIIAVTVLIISFTVSALATTWEGSAMMSSYGDFPSSGYYAACNSFQRNTVIEVMNSETGKSITAIVTRTIDSAGVFLVLSPEAASAIGIKPGSLVKVRVTIPLKVTSLAQKTDEKTEQPLDPDFNPQFFTQRPAISSETPPAKTDGKTTEDKIDTESPTVKPGMTKIAETPDTLNIKEPSQLSMEKPLKILSEPQVPALPSQESMKPDKPVKTAETADLFIPDEAPQKESPAIAPSTYEFPESRPEILALQIPQNIRRKPESEQKKISPEETVTTIARTQPGNLQKKPELDLVDPSYRIESPGMLVNDKPLQTFSDLPIVLSDPDDSVVFSEKAEEPGALFFDAPAVGKFTSTSELAEPDIMPDELPQILIANMSKPQISIPEFALAESEVEMEEMVSDMIVYDKYETKPLKFSDSDLDMAALIPGEIPALYEAQMLPVQDETIPQLAEAEMTKTEHPTVYEGGQFIAGKIDSRILDDAVPFSEETPSILNGTRPIPQKQEITKKELEAPVLSAKESGAEGVVLQPAKETPPKIDEKETIPSGISLTEQAEISKSRATFIGKLEHGKHYIQLGAFKTIDVLNRASESIDPDFDLVVETLKTTSALVYRLYIGPLDRDEIGLALMQLRSKGFSEAFMRVGE